MLRAFTILFVSSAFLSAAYGQTTVRFSGRLEKGNRLRRAINQDLVFQLEPTEEGWTIEIRPNSQTASQATCGEFVWVVTPPYRSSNPRYISTEFGMTATEAVRWSSREFEFVTNCRDYKTEYDRVEHVLWPYQFPEQEVDDARAKLGTSTKGTGKLVIKKSKTSNTGRAEPASTQIDWFEFEVELRLPG